MSPDERHAILERKVLRLQSVVAEFGKLIRESLAEQNMMFAEVLSLIESSQSPNKLGPILRNELAKVDSVAVFQANDEGQIQAGQDAQIALLSALG